MSDLPVGFRFYPTEEELLSYYLPRKLNAMEPAIDRVIPLVNIYDYNPSELPQIAGEVCRGDKEQWFFFTEMQEREMRGGRPNRRTERGYWKATGSPSDVYDSRNLRIGRKKTMVFYEGRAPYGKKTTWKMNEYKVYDTRHHPSLPADLQLREELSLCRIYKRSKCPRSFDRRLPVPVEEVAVHDEAPANHHHNHQDSTADVAVETNDNQRNPTGVESGFINWDMETLGTTETLWDSEFFMLLNYFDF